jgi:hypothetical protein
LARAQALGSYLILGPNQFSGVVFKRSKIAPTVISDGLSYTYLLGEKLAAPDYYETGQNSADDQNAFVGFDWDAEPRDASSPGQPRRWPDDRRESVLKCLAIPGYEVCRHPPLLW